jgi:hypothetical protein
MMLEKLLREEDNTLILNKLNIHDELKETVISKHLANRAHNQMLRDSLIRDTKQSFKKKGTNDLTGDSLNTTSTAYRGNARAQNSPLSGYNDSNSEAAVRRVLNLDIGAGADTKFNIISDSPINGPGIASKHIGLKTRSSMQTPIKKTTFNIKKSKIRQSRSIDCNNTYDEVSNMDTTNHLQTEIEEEIVSARLTVNKKSMEMEKKGKASPFTCKYKKSALKSIINLSSSGTRNTISTTMTMTASTSMTTSNSKTRKIAAINNLTSRLKK